MEVGSQAQFPGLGGLPEAVSGPARRQQPSRAPYSSRSACHTEAAGKAGHEEEVSWSPRRGEAERARCGKLVTGETVRGKQGREESRGEEVLRRQSRREEKVAVKIRLGSITKRRGASKQSAVDELTAEYVKRAARYGPVQAVEYATEAALLKSLERPGRTAALLVALDSGGKQFSSEELADFVAQQMERGTQELVLAVGPADGWSNAVRGRAQVLLSLGKMTLPHELARVVLAEQIYRAFTILNRHPYHSGH